MERQAKKKGLVAESFERKEDQEAVVHSYFLDNIQLKDEDIQVIVSQINHLQQTQKENCQLKIYLSDNNIGDQGCKHLQNALWPNLTLFYLFQNFIGWKGCISLAKCPWTNLKDLELAHNSIGDKGLKYICSADWPSLQFIDLYQNGISEIGSCYLSKARWKNLTGIILRNNHLNSQSCAFVAKTQWDSLNHLDLSQQKGKRIYEIGCRQLSKSIFANIRLVLNWNNIGVMGLRVLKHKNWNVFCDDQF